MITKEQFNNLNAGDVIRCFGRKMIVTRAPYAEDGFMKIRAIHNTKKDRSMHILDNMDCCDITFVAKDDPEYPAMKSCSTCQFRGTYYCSHPHTCNDGQGRCGKSEIVYRIKMIEEGKLTTVRHRTTPEQARQMLIEWESEQQ